MIRPLLVDVTFVSTSQGRGASSFPRVAAWYGQPPSCGTSGSRQKRTQSPPTCSPYDMHCSWPGDGVAAGGQLATAADRVLAHKRRRASEPVAEWKS